MVTYPTLSVALGGNTQCLKRRSVCLVNTRVRVRLHMAQATAAYRPEFLLLCRLQRGRTTKNYNPPLHRRWHEGRRRRSPERQRRNCRPLQRERRRCGPPPPPSATLRLEPTVTSLMTVLVHVQAAAWREIMSHEEGQHIRVKVDEMAMYRQYLSQVLCCRSRDCSA